MKKRPPKSIKSKKAAQFNKKMERLGKCNVDSNGDVVTGSGSQSLAGTPSFHAPYSPLKGLGENYYGNHHYALFDDIRSVHGAYAPETLQDIGNLTGKELEQFLQQWKEWKQWKENKMKASPPMNGSLIDYDHIRELLLR